MLCEVPQLAPETQALEGKPQRPILVVEDDPHQREVLEHRLRKQGCVVISAASAEVGLALAREHQPQLVLLDLELPEGDGLSLCEQLYDDPQTSDLPVIIVSGSDRDDIVRASRAAGCRYFLRKPYDPNALWLLAESLIN